MTTKPQLRRTWTLRLMWVLAIGFMVWLYQASPRYSLRTYLTSAGWGYDILRNNIPLIHQPTQPAVAGRLGFESEEHARRVGERALAKIRQGQFPPTLSPADLK
ncbi:hypothetical protein GGR92_001229 [Spirosoma lacussanchae]|uniref:DUF4907 domain-containing protein n=1 Tax=Spirosoma lacussanchae TaxID=1884249 RepID=UPI0011080BC9|nr:DUF4907 domain-containing protein [Spirosoma lacussanchae]